MSNIDNEQEKNKGRLPEDAKLEDVIASVNQLKDSVNYILELIKTRNF